MNQTKIPSSGTLAAQVRATVDRLNLDENRAAAYLGVPVFTVRKWLTGEREPGAAVARLLEVLGLVEALAPGLHASFLPPVARGASRKPGRVKKSNPKLGHVDQSGASGSTD